MRLKNFSALASHPSLKAFKDYKWTNIVLPADPTRLKQNLNRTNVVFIFLIDFSFTRLNSVESFEFLINSTISAKKLCTSNSIKKFAFVCNRTNKEYCRLHACVVAMEISKYARRLFTSSDSTKHRICIFNIELHGLC